MPIQSVFIASVLKPVTDSRNYEKLAISISQTGKYHVTLLGQGVRELPTHKHIAFLPFGNYSRLSFRRFLVGLQFLKLLVKHRPAVILVTTFELLVPVIIYKLFSKAILIYDVQENYFRNLWYGNTLPAIIKHGLAIFIRVLEYVTRPFVANYFLAERNYEQEFSFSKGKSVVLENKLRKDQVIPRTKRDDGFIQFLYSGTIAESYGIFDAISFIKKLHQLNDKVRLIIIGYAAQHSVFERLKMERENFSFITLIGGDHLVPHQEILEYIAKADFGLIPYQPNKSTENCIPTKLYEYHAHQLPYLITKNKVWNEITTSFDAGTVVDFALPPAENFLQDLKSRVFYKNSPSDDVFWQEDNILQTL